MLSLVIILSLSFHGLLGQSDICAEGGTLTQNEEIDCNDDNSCEGCDLITCNNCDRVRCNGQNACLDSNILVPDANTDFEFECNDTGGCASRDRNEDHTIVITCGNGESIKGIKCTSGNACRGQTITINGCDVEKVECKANNACEGVTFTCQNGADVEEFICDSGSCNNLICSGCTTCP